MWFLVVLFAPHQNEALARAMAVQGYSTHRVCMAAAPERVGVLARIEMHGRYLCMRHGERGAQLVATEKGSF